MIALSKLFVVKQKNKYYKNKKRIKYMIKKDPEFTVVKRIADQFFKTSVELERVPEGASTYVYHIRIIDKIYYLRILPEDASFAVEVKVHELLINQGVKVPKVIHFEHRNVLVEKSIMIVDEIPGICLDNSSEKKDFKNILFQAGKQIALINQIKVAGFGWINREVWDTLSGEKSSFSEYYHEHLYNDISILPEYQFNDKEIMTISDYLKTAFTLLDETDAHLAHGDFDLTHIFHNNGIYTGIIDFGEIRGNSILYDLAQFKFEDQIPSEIGFDPLIKGYKEIYDLTSEDIYKINLLALFIGIRRLGGRNYKYFISKVRRQLEDLDKNF